MKFILSFILLFIVFQQLPAFSQTKIDTQTSAPQDARYEIVKSNMFTDYTFRLDRFTGNVSKLVIPNEKGRMSWSKMKIEGLTVTKATKPVFQIFTSGTDGRQTFLINNQTGESWALSNAVFGSTSELVLMWIKFTPE